MPRWFEDRVAWVTGGGSGIGRALAVELARQGAAVAVSGRRADRLDAVVAEIAEAGGRGLAVPCDVTDDSAVAGCAEKVASELGSLDLAVANAGLSISGRFEKLGADEWRKQFEVNVLGAVSTARHALPALHESRGRLGLVGSVAAFTCFPASSAYCSSKFALRAIGLTLAQELHGSGVSVTLLHPGFVASEIAQVDNRGVFHPDREDKRPKNLMWSAEKAARVMARALYKRKREYVFTGHGKMGAWLGKHLPGLIHFATTRRSR